MNHRHAALCAALSAMPLSAGASCGSAFCSVNTSFDVQGAWTEPGARVDLRYESINQDQPRAGSAKVGVGQIPRHHDEVSTLNRNWIASLDYAFDPAWGVAVTAPFVDREHFHIHNHAGGKLPGDSMMEVVGDRFAGRDCLPVRERRHIEIEVFAVERLGHLFRKDAVENAEIHHHARDRIDVPAHRNCTAIVVGVAGLGGAFAESGAVLFR